MTFSSISAGFYDDSVSNPSRHKGVTTMRIAVFDGPSVPGDKAANLARLEALAAQAAATGAALLVLPQLFATGPCRDAAAAERMAELSDGPIAQRLTAIARSARIAILCGYVEQCTGQRHDAALLVDAGGRALANYRRTHLPPGADREAFAPGQWLTITLLGEVRAGILIGPDIEAPEPARALALAGARILLVPADHDAAAAMVGQAVLSARAFENGVGLAYANAAADAAAPRSRLVAPDGTVLATAAPGGLALAEVPMAPPPAAARRLASRRPRLYQKLALPGPGEEGPRL
jgi:predicted amidohydrolase